MEEIKSIIKRLNKKYEIELRFCDILTSDFDDDIIQYHLDDDIEFDGRSNSSISLHRRAFMYGITGDCAMNYDVGHMVETDPENIRFYFNEDIVDMIEDVYIELGE